MAWQIIPSIASVSAAPPLSMISRRRMIPIIAAERFGTRRGVRAPIYGEERDSLASLGLGP